ncbi:hypothetical protein NLG97_g1977 [Lecanicillium saksenae]|uniref:Uncharacterized protein n=1 Tax=Lecanicillium saksenae TaxID=468837 RepID=A0ACC1R2F4_9HYPO|nr:hypothetical protein NLG97_g1977 [Lecanicillium saksenae]
MQAHLNSRLQARRAQQQQQQQRVPQDLSLRSSHLAPRKFSRQSGVAPGAVALQQGVRASGVRVGHGTETGHAPMADTMSGALPSNASSDNFMKTIHELQSQIDSLRQSKGQEETLSLSDPNSNDQNGASSAVEYDEHIQEIEFLRKEVEDGTQEMTALRQDVENGKRVMERLGKDTESLKKMVNESLGSLRDQLSVLMNTCPFPGEADPFAYPPLPSV